MTMIERVTKAVRSYEVMRHNLEWRVVRLSGFGDIRFRSKVFDEAQARCDELNARAVVEAMLEPSQKMREAGFCTTPDDDAVVVWKVMIDAALTEPEAPSPR